MENCERRNRYSTEEATPSVKINYNALKVLKLTAHSFNTYFLTVVEAINNDTRNVTEDATKYLGEAIPKAFPNTNLIPSSN